MKKMVLVLIVLMAVSGSLFASGQSESSDDTLKIAALLPGPMNDGGWNTLMYSSLEFQAEKFGAEIAYTERTPSADYEEIFRGYAEAGFDIIFGHGFEFGDSAMKVAKEFPEVYFVINSTGISQKDNLGSFLVNDFQCGFAQGAIAAIKSESGVVGFIGGMEIPPIVNQAAGFVAGAKYANPSIDVKSILTGNFEDIAKAKEMALSMIADGADVLVGDADEASHGVFEAAEENHVLVIGCSTDLYETAPDIRDIILTSVTEDMPMGHSLIVEGVIADKFEAKNYMIGFESGAVNLAPFREMESELSAEQMAKIDDVIAGLKDGSIDMEMYK